MLPHQAGGDGIGGVAVQTVAGMIMPAVVRGVFAAGAILEVAQGSPGIPGKGDRRVAQAGRRELLASADPGGAGQAAHQGAGVVPVQADRVPPQAAQNSNPRSAWRSGR
jgi:hypothetical protein